VRLEALRGRLSKLAREMPALVSSDVATARHASALERIAAEPAGPRRDLVVRLAVAHCRQVDEPVEYAEFLAAVGDERLRCVFPDGAPAVCPDAAFRARARAWKTPSGYQCRISQMLREQIAQQQAVQL
jgi:hypothetical protein